jgi:hypothetical protein
VAVDGAQSFDAVAGLGDDLDARHLLELVTQLFAGELLVVDDEHAKECHALDILH